MSQHDVAVDEGRAAGFVRCRMLPGSPFAHRELLAAAVCPFLSINDLLACSSLARPHQSLFDGETVWRPRVDRLQRLHSLPPPAPPQSDALSDAPDRPLPPLAEVVRLVLAKLDEQETLHGVVHLAGSSTYHSRASIHGDWDQWNTGWLVLRTRSDVLRFDEQSQQWTIAHTQFNNGWAAGNTCNVVDGILVDTPTATAATSKLRYIRMRRCSEHDQTQCHRLLPPMPPLPSPSPSPRDIHKSLTSPDHRLPVVRQPPLVPLPLCAACQPRLTEPLQQAMDSWFGRGRERRRVSCVVRVNRLDVDACVEEDDCLSRRCVLQPTESGQYCARMVASDVELYSILHPSNVAPFSSASSQCRAVQCAAHAQRCSGQLVERTSLPPSMSWRSETNAACRQCGGTCVDEQLIAWCRRCWYTLCGTCTQAEEQTRRSDAVVMEAEGMDNAAC